MMDNFFVDEIDYYRFNLFQPQASSLIIQPALPQAIIVPVLYLLEIPYSPRYNPNPLSGIL